MGYERDISFYSRHKGRLTRLLVGLVIVALAIVSLLVGSSPSPAQDTQTSLTAGRDAREVPESSAPIWATRVKGIVTPVIADYVTKTIQRAERQGASALIVEIDTPGGLDSAMRDIIQAQIEASIAVIFYVHPQGARAASAGVYILMGADVAAMSPQTNLGSAQPVAMGGDLDEEMRKKVVNDAAAYIRGLAESHGRNADWAEQAVRESVSLTAEEALVQGVVDFVAADRAELLQLMHGYVTKPKGLTLSTATAPVVEVAMGWRQRFLQALVNPEIAYILLIIGIYGLIFELQSPGLGFAGIGGIISLLLAFYALQILPVSYVGLALIFIAMALFVAEVVIQSGGLLGIGGTVALVAGGLLLFDAPEAYLRVNWPVVIGVGLVSLGFVFLVIKAVARAWRRTPVTGLQGLVGAVGVVRRDLSPEGQVLVQGELWRARAREGELRAGEEIVVVEVAGLELLVRRK